MGITKTWLLADIMEAHNRQLHLIFGVRSIVSLDLDKHDAYRRPGRHCRAAK